MPGLLHGRRRRAASAPAAAEALTTVQLRRRTAGPRRCRAAGAARRPGWATATSRKQLGDREVEARAGQRRGADAPEQPDREAEVLGEDRPGQVAAGDRLPRASQNSGSSGRQSVDPAAGAVGGGCRRWGLGHGCSWGSGAVEPTLGSRDFAPAAPRSRRGRLVLTASQPSRPHRSPSCCIHSGHACRRRHPRRRLRHPGGGRGQQGAAAGAGTRSWPGRCARPSRSSGCTGWCSWYVPARRRPSPRRSRRTSVPTTVGSSSGAAPARLGVAGAADARRRDRGRGGRRGGDPRRGPATRGRRALGGRHRGPRARRSHPGGGADRTC